MATFQFDASKPFKENCEIFLEKLKEEDVILATVLEKNWDKLIRVVSADNPSPDARKEFNSSVALALDATIDASHLKDSK